MKYRNVGKWGLKVSEIALGAWTTYGESVEDLPLIKQITRVAYEGGVNFFDNADVYALGKGEQVMGRVLSDYPRHTLVMSSKVYWPMSDDINDRGLSRKHIRESIDNSLRNLKTDYLDLYFAHRHDDAVPMEEIVTTFSGLLLLISAIAAIQGGYLLLLAGLMALVAVGLVTGGSRLAKRLQCSWTGRIVIYAEQFAQNPDPALLNRLDQFCDTVIATLDKGEEVILTGHSFGAVLAPMIAARITQRRPELVADPSHFCLLTLGSIMPFVAHHPSARHIRADLKTVDDSGLAWLDISSPRDGACCALVNPLAFVGLKGKGPKLLNAQFHKTFSPERLKAGLRKPLEGHFFYLQAPDTPDPKGDLYDWAATLVDSRPVWQRYQTRASQPSFYRG